MVQDNPFHKKLIEGLGDPNVGKGATEQKIGVFNFAALKGTIGGSEEFRLAVNGLKRFRNENPEAFDGIHASMVTARDDKLASLGIEGMTPAQVLDNVFDDVNALPEQQRAAALEKIVRVKQNMADGIDELGKAKGEGRV